MPETSDPPNEQHAAPTEEVRDAIGKLGELRAYVQQYVSAKIDLAKVSARNVAIYAALGIIGLLVATATIVIALVLLLVGLAEAIGAAMGGRVWAGNLIVGGGLILLLAGAVMFGLAKLKRSSLKSLVTKYERKQREQTDSFGQSSRDRTASGGSVEV